jgi:hypothetical protein
VSIFDASTATPGPNITGNQTSGDTHLGLYDNSNLATPAPLKGLGLATPNSLGAYDY